MSDKVKRPTQAERIDAQRYLCATDPREALRVFRWLYARLPEDEKRARAHLRHDGAGFKEEEQAELCLMYELMERRGRVLAHEQAMLLREMPKYAAQYVKRTDAEYRERQAEQERVEAVVHAGVEVPPSEATAKRRRVGPQDKPARQRREVAEQQTAARLAELHAMTADQHQQRAESHPFWGAWKQNPGMADSLPA